MTMESVEEPSSSSTRKEQRPPGGLQYAIEDVPPWYLWIVLGFQHYLTMIGSTLSVPIILAPRLCMEVGAISDDVAKAELLGTILFTSGLVTFLQTTFGSRLPIVQGGSFAFFPPVFALLSTFGSCPTLLSKSANVTDYLLENPNTTLPVVIVGSPEHTEIWQTRMRAIQGSIMVAALFQILIGFTGVIGVLLRFIGPLVIAPTIALIGLSLFTTAGEQASTQWGIAVLTIALLALFAEYMKNIKIPVYSTDLKRCSNENGYPIFRLFPVILAILVAYSLSAILTYTNVFPNDPDSPNYAARTDIRVSVIESAQWFRFPYPVGKTIAAAAYAATWISGNSANQLSHSITMLQGQWGLPTVTVAGVFGMLAGVLSSIVESVGDYYAAARLSGAPPPTSSAINRGIGVEGIGCVLAGAFGTGLGTTSISQNIGAMGITKVGSRRVIQTGGVIMIVFAVVGKFCAVFVTVPYPILGGIYMVMFGMVAAVGISSLQFVDLNSTRNLFILGLSLLLGLAVPDWTNKNTDQINTGSHIIDEIFVVLLKTSMFVGGAVAFFLDNTIPGTPEERGLTVWRKQETDECEADPRERLRCYDMPFGNDWIYRSHWTRYIPICPNFLSHRKKNSDIAQDIDTERITDGDHDEMTL